MQKAFNIVVGIVLIILTGFLVRMESKQVVLEKSYNADHVSIWGRVDDDTMKVNAIINFINAQIQASQQSAPKQ